METRQTSRKWERKSYRTKLTLTLENGVRIDGYSDNVSVSGLLLTLNMPFESVEVGMLGDIRTDPNQDDQSFPCEVVRISEAGISVNFRDEQASFGMFITHDIMLDLLTKINNSFARSLKFEETLHTSVDHIRDFLDCEAASLFLLENDDQDLVCHASAGPVDITGLRLDPDEGIIGRTIQSGKTLIVDDVWENPHFAARVDDATGFTTEFIICAPLIIQDRTIGALEVLNKHGSNLFAGHDRIILTALASATAMAVQNARNAERFVEHKHDQVVQLEKLVDEKIKDLENKEQREGTILNNIADAVIIIDKRGNISMFNAAAEKMFGYTADEITGRNVSILLPDDERSDHDGYLANTNMHASRIINQIRALEGQRKDQSRFPLELNVSPLMMGTNTGYIGVLRDISERKAVERSREEQTGLISLMYAIGETATQCDDMATMYQVCLDEICSYLHWPVGHVYLMSEREDDLLETTSIWHLADTGEFLDFRAVTDQTQFKFGIGLPGSVGLSGKPLWIEDVTQSDNFPRAGVAKKCGIRSGLAIPVIVDDKIISILEFFASEIVPADAARDQALAQITRQIGQSANRISAEQALGESERRFRGIVENAGDAIYIHDRYGKIYDVNQNACDELGYTRDELLTLTVADIEAALDMNDLRRTWDIGTTEPEKYPITLEGLHRRKDGSTFPMEVRFGVLGIQDEIMFIAIVRNITERKTEEEKSRLNEERFRDFTSTASDWVWEMGADLRFSYVSDRFFDFFPIDKGTIIGRTRWEFAGQETLERAPDKWDKHRQGMEEHLPFRNFQYQVGDAEKSQYISLSGNPVFNKDGGFAGYRGTGADVSELQKVQKDMVRAKESAETANRAKSEFLSSMSHELRTPLNAILGFGQMLQYNPKEPLSKTQQTSVDYILKGGQHLLDLINDVLDLAKIEAGKVDLSIEDIRPADVVNECLALIDEMAGKRDITIISPDINQETSPVRADYTRLKQVLLNLISNAVKYNAEKGSITIAFDKVTPGMLRFSVTDTGPGIAKGKQDGLFTAFNRLGAENSEIEGTGIGLVVSRDLVEMMKGTIGFESTEGKGSTFWFELPLSHLSVDAGLMDERSLGNNTGGPLQKINATMLYVEDNPPNLHLMELIASRVEGLGMISAHTAELGIDLAVSKQPDVIILDINLPGMDGYEALKILQDKIETRDIPVLALSANASHSDFVKGDKSGFLRYLTKPIKVTEIIEAIRIALKNRSKA